MKINSTLLLTAVALGASVLLATAQDSNQAPPPDQGPPPEQGPPRRGGGGPVMAALDANHDGVIDKDEIANASEALKSLDKNGDGILSGDEIHPPRPGGPGGPGGKPAHDEKAK